MKDMIKADLIDPQNLTPRESEVAALLCEGLSDKAIAKALAISIKTLAVHLANIYGKLECRQHSVNARCSAIVTMIGRGMVIISTRALCLVVLVAQLGLDDDSVARVGRTRLPRPTVTRLKNREG